MAEKKQTQKQTRSNPLQVVRTAANKARNQVRAASDRIFHEAKKGVIVRRGTTRRLRREAWAGIRQQVIKQVTVHVPRMIDGKFVMRPEVHSVKTWKPTFEEFSKGGQLLLAKING